MEYKNLLKNIDLNTFKKEIKKNPILWRLYNILSKCYTIIRQHHIEIRFLFKYGLKYNKIVKYLHIDGWLTENEAIALYKLTFQIQKDKPRAVEIGSWLGKSSFIIAKGLKKNTVHPKLYCIDPFNADGDALSKTSYKQFADELKSMEDTSLKEKFIQNMVNYHVFDIITAIDGYSYDCVKKFNQQIDFLFIDGNHDYKAVLQDYLDWSKLLKVGGVIVFHDVDFDPFSKPLGTETNLGPGLVIKKYLTHNSNWTDFHLIDGLFYAIKKFNE